MRSDLEHPLGKNARLFLMGTLATAWSSLSAAPTAKHRLRCSVHSGGKARPSSSLQHASIYQSHLGLMVLPVLSARSLGAWAQAFRPPICTTHHALFSADLLYLLSRLEVEFSR